MTDTALALQPKNGELVPITPMGLLQIAMSQNADLDKLEKLMQLKREWDADEARKAYDEAMAKFKAHPPRITKNRHVEFGQTAYDHATLDHITDVLTAALSAVGISHRFEVQQQAESITVTCILRHQTGHSERTSLSGPPDKSGSKNPIQAVGSAVTYLQRYSLLASVGMAAAGQDNDGAGAAQSPQMPEQQYIEQLDNIQNAESLVELQHVFGVAYKVAQAAADKTALAAFIKAKDAKKAELK